MYVNFGKMIDSKTLFIDTSPFIYYLEKSDIYFDTMKTFFLDCYTHQKRLLTSPITIEEYCVYHLKNNSPEHIHAFRSFLFDIGITIKPIESDIAFLAAKLRAKYQGIKPMDALQLSTAISYNCDMFLTNDKQLKQITELQIVLVEEL